MSDTFNWCKDKTKLSIWNKQVFIVNCNGVKYWCKYWYLNGKLHRVDGPAVEWSSGSKMWYLNGIYYYESDYWKELKK